MSPKRECKSEPRNITQDLDGQAPGEEGDEPVRGGRTLLDDLADHAHPVRHHPTLPFPGVIVEVKRHERDIHQHNLPMEELTISSMMRSPSSSPPPPSSLTQPHLT